jgi:hypothetical protein
LRETDEAWIASLSPYLRGEVLARLIKVRTDTRDQTTNEILDAVSADLLYKATRND